MSDQMYWLTDEDRRVLRGVIDRERKRVQAKRPTSIANQDAKVEDNPWTYVAFPTGTGGIPAAEESGTSNPPTTVPGTADADVYKLDHNTGELVNVYQYSVPVYNLSPFPIASGLLIVTKDKFGRYWVVGGDDNSGNLDCLGCGWVSALENTDCLKLTVVDGAGRCSCINDGQVIYFKYSGSAATWVAYNPTTFVTCCGTPTIEFDVSDRGEPHLALTGVFDGCGPGGAGALTGPWDLTLECCGDNFAYFAGGTSALCDGQPDISAGPAGNTFRVKIEWIPVCPNPDYTTAGWYCVSSSAGCTVQSAIHYTSDPGLGVFLCSGPYVSQAAAEAAACPPPGDVSVCSGSHTVPSVLVVTFHDCLGMFTDLNGRSIVLTRVGATVPPVWSGNLPWCGNTCWEFVLSVDDGGGGCVASWDFIPNMPYTSCLTSTSVSGTNTSAVSSWSPFSFTGTTGAMTGLNICEASGSEGTVTFTVTQS